MQDPKHHPDTQSIFEMSTSNSASKHGLNYTENTVTTFYLYQAKTCKKHGSDIYSVFSMLSSCYSPKHRDLLSVRARAVSVPGVGSCIVEYGIDAVLNQAETLISGSLPGIWLALQDTLSWDLTGQLCKIQGQAFPPRGNLVLPRVARRHQAEGVCLVWCCEYPAIC